MKIIIFNMSSKFEWDRGIYNRNKHILDEISKRDDVEAILSVDFLPFDFRSWLRLYLKGGVFKKIGKNVILFGHHFIAKRLNKKVISLTALNMKKVKKAADKLGFNDAIILNYNPLNISYFKYFEDNKKYFDAVDNWAENEVFKDLKAMLLGNYKFLIRNSDFVFTKPQKLKDNLITIAYCEQKTPTALVCCNIKDNVKVVLNGVDLDHYKKAKQLERIDSIFEEIDQKYKIKIGYLGVIKEDRVDSDLLEYLITEHKDKMFIIAGPIFGNFDKTRFYKYDNIIFPGEMSYDEMSALYAKFNICIIPHILNDFIKSMDPMKLYGYLAAGKPVITVPVPGTEQFKDIIKIANTKESFSNSIKEISDNIEEYSSKDKIDIRQKSVEQYSWKSKADEIMETIKNS